MNKYFVDFLADDGVKLQGYMIKNDTDKVLIEVHGMTSNCFKDRESTIANEVSKIGVDTLCFNTRGSEVVKFIKDKNGNKRLAGTAYEDIEESYFDILGAIKYLVNLGYKEIYLQGHSLGSTKSVYTYNRMQNENNQYLKYIKKIILLSLVDVPDMIKSFSNEEDIKILEKKKSEGKVYDLIQTNTFLGFISVGTYLKLMNCKEIDFARYSKEDNAFEVLNNIKIPIFMRWGDTNELIHKDAKNQVEFMNMKIKNEKKDIDFIEGADHSYSGKEELLAKQICSFINE